MQFPVKETSISNTASIELPIIDRATQLFQVALEIAEGSATTGTVTVEAIPFGGSKWQSLEGNISCSQPQFKTFSGKFRKLRFVPDSLDAGARFTIILDSLGRG